MLRYCILNKTHTIIYFIKRALSSSFIELVHKHEVININFCNIEKNEFYEKSGLIF